MPSLAPTTTTKLNRRGGFTLIELLVVVAIIAALIAILLPSMSRARESAKRVVCGTQARSMAMVALTYANAEKGHLPDLNDSRNQYAQNALPYPYWACDNRRDYLLTHFGMTRASFYCPSNDEWNTDSFWNEDGASAFTGPKALVMGYAYYGNNERTNEPPTQITWSHTPARTPICANTLSDRPDLDVLVTDLSRSSNGVFGIGGNHVEGPGVEPTPAQMPAGSGGTNVGRLDGSVEWRNQNDMVSRWSRWGSALYRFYW